MCDAHSVDNAYPDYCVTTSPFLSCVNKHMCVTVTTPSTTKLCISLKSFGFLQQIK